MVPSSILRTGFQVPCDARLLGGCGTRVRGIFKKIRPARPQAARSPRRTVWHVEGFEQRERRWWTFSIFPFAQTVLAVPPKLAALLSHAKGDRATAFQNRGSGLSNCYLAKLGARASYRVGFLVFLEMMRAGKCT